MINALFRLKGLFGFKVNTRVLFYLESVNYPKEEIEKIKQIVSKFYKTDEVLVIGGCKKEGVIEVIYY